MVVSSPKSEEMKTIDEQIEESVKRFREKFELHDLGKDEFTLCCNNEEDTCDGGISIAKENQEEAERHLDKLEQFLRTELKAMAERVEAKTYDKVHKALCSKCKRDYGRAKEVLALQKER